MCRPSGTGAENNGKSVLRKWKLPLVAAPPRCVTLSKMRQLEKPIRDFAILSAMKSLLAAAIAIASG